AVSIFFGLLAQFARVLSDAMALLNQRLAIEGGQLIVLAVALYVLQSFGLTGVVGAIAISQMLQFVLYMVLIKRKLGFIVEHYMMQIAPGLIASVLIGFALAGSLSLLDSVGASPGATLICQVVVGVLGLVALGR